MCVYASNDKSPAARRLPGPENKKPANSPVFFMTYT